VEGNPPKKGGLWREMCIPLKEGLRNDPSLRRRVTTSSL
jgi:hypothetical protein